MNINRAKKTKYGFTLIELLVVVAIISLLSSIVMASLSSARVKARNVRRLADVEQLVLAFNMRLNDGDSLPSSAGGCGSAPGWVCVSDACSGWAYSGFCSSMTHSTTVDDFLRPYLSKLPSDPQDGHVRTFGNNSWVDGYIYNSNWIGGTATSSDHTVFPSGAYIQFMVEAPYKPGICGANMFTDIDPSTGWNYVTCRYKLD